MREPSLEAKYFCSSTKSTCELTNETPGDRERRLVQLHQERDLGVERHVERVALERARPRRHDLVGVGEDHLARRERGVRAGDRDRLFRRRSRRGRLDAIGRGKAPRAVDQHAQPEPPAGRPRHVLDLPLACRDRFAAIAVDPDVGVRCTQRRRRARAPRRPPRRARHRRPARSETRQPTPARARRDRARCRWRGTHVGMTAIARRLYRRRLCRFQGLRRLVRPYVEDQRDAQDGVRCTTSASKTTAARRRTR